MRHGEGGEQVWPNVLEEDHGEDPSKVSMAGCHHGPHDHAVHQQQIGLGQASLGGDSGRDGDIERIESDRERQSVGFKIHRIFVNYLVIQMVIKNPMNVDHGIVRYRYELRVSSFSDASDH